METLKVDILDPKARKVLTDLEESKLISIRKEKDTSFSDVLRKIRYGSGSVIGSDEITALVEAVRNARYDQ